MEWSHPTGSGAARTGLLVALLVSAESLAADLFVSGADPSCQGTSPCYATIQDAVDDALPGDRIQILPGTYRENLRIRRKNGAPASRIVIARADDAPAGSVILLGRRSPQACQEAIDVSGSSFVTIRGLVIRGATGPGIRLRGGPNRSTDVSLERNRILENGTANGSCAGGIAIEGGNGDTVVVNNVIYANRGHGIEISDVPTSSSGRRRGLAGGPHYLIENTIHRNEGTGIEVGPNQSVVIVNNAVTENGANGANGRSRARGGFGVGRHPSRARDDGSIAMWNNLLCNNARGEVDGPVFVGQHDGNLTPTGAESPGVTPSPECLEPRGVYQNVGGQDETEGTIDDNFALRRPGAQGLPSPAIDRGLDPRTLSLDESIYAVLESDFDEVGARPVQRDTHRELDFDIGALELDCSCAQECESCEIVVHEDGTSSDRCAPGYTPATQCCNRVTGVVSEKHLGSAYTSCPATRVARPTFNPFNSSDGCSAVPDNPFPLCSSVRFGCDNDSQVPNCPDGTNLPCNNHDYCYQTCGRTKAECDSAFYLDMIAVCNAMTVPQILVCYDNCVITAGTYYDGVVAAGQSSYVNGQNRGCQCCTDVFPTDVAP